MNRNLSAVFSLIPEGRTATDIASVLCRKADDLGKLPIFTHWCWSKSPLMDQERYKKWRGSDGWPDLGGARSIMIASIPEDSPEIDSAYAQFHVSVSDSQSRGVRCVILEISFCEKVARLNSQDVLFFLDWVAAEFRVQSGRVHDLEDMTDQNQIGIQWFKVSGKPVDKSKIKYSDALGREIIDTEENPCHIHVVGVMDFCVAWVIYIGKGFSELIGNIPADDLLNIGVDVRNISDEVTRLRVFEDPFAFADDTNVGRLWATRRLLRIDEVAHKFAEPY